MMVKITIYMPVYNAGKIINETMNYILNQSFEDFEIIITDDNSTDDTQEIIKEINDPRIKYYRFNENVGYPKNLQRCVGKSSSSSEILFLMGQDDILATSTLEKINRIFDENENVGAITRPYYWFHDDIDKPVRTKATYDKNNDAIISIDADFRSIVQVFQTLDQLTGLAYRRKFIDWGFHEDVFTCHVYAFASIFKKHEIVYLKDYTVAVQIGTSQTRHVSWIYEKSPIQSWVDMFSTVFSEDKFALLREYCIKQFVTKNFVGLIQIKNYGKPKWVIREIVLLIKYNLHNILDLRFWFFSVGTLILPSFILIPLVDFYKENILSKSLTNIKLID